MLRLFFYLEKTHTISQCQVSVDLILNLHPANHALPYLNTFAFSVSVSHMCSVWKDNVFFACTKSYSLAFLLQHFHYCIPSFTTMPFWTAFPFPWKEEHKCVQMMIYNGLQQHNMWFSCLKNRRNQKNRPGVCIQSVTS